MPPNERLQELFHPWTSYLIVPLFALANAGIVVKGDFLATAFRSPITWGVIVAYVVGKPLGIAGGSWVVTRLSRGGLRPSVGWASVIGAGTVSGIGFTLSLLIATIAFDGRQLDEAKLGILAAAIVSSAITWVVFRATAALPPQRRARALLGDAQTVTDLAEPVDPERDHVRGPEESPVTLVEYGDFQCPYCGQAEPVVRQVLADFGDVRYVWRHLPLRDVHPQAQLAAEAAEAACRPGSVLGDARPAARAAGRAQARRTSSATPATSGSTSSGSPRTCAVTSTTSRVSDDVESADLSGVRGTPTFFINGMRHHGAYDVAGLEEAVRLARAKALAAG